MFDAEFIVAPTCLMLDRCRWQEQLKMEIEIDFYNKIFLQESWNKKTELFCELCKGKAWLDILKKRIE